MRDPDRVPMGRDVLGVVLGPFDFLRFADANQIAVTRFLWD